jgi:hypothetical protein
MIAPLLLLAAAAAAASGEAHYDCVVDRQQVLTANGAGWNQSQVKFEGAQQADWRFTVDLATGEHPQARVRWDKDLVQIAGTHPVIRLAPGYFAFVPVRASGCLFTEEACVAIVELSDGDEGKASFLILPAGLALNADTGKRSLFQVTSVGHCSRTSKGR